MSTHQVQVIVDRQAKSIIPGLKKGADLRDALGLGQDDNLFFEVKGDIDVHVAAHDYILVTGGEEFSVAPPGSHLVEDNPPLRHPIRCFLNDQMLSETQALRYPKLKAAELKALDPNAAEGSRLVADLDGLVDELLDDAYRIIVKPNDKFIVIPAQERHEPHKVSVRIDGKDITLPVGDYRVSELKKLLGVLIDYDLDHVKHGVFEHLPDDSMFELRHHEEFVSHVRTGSSS